MRILFLSFFLLFGLSFFLIAPQARADVSNAVCENATNKGSCQEVCGESDTTRLGRCTDNMNAGLFCCIPPASGRTLTESQCTSQGGHPENGGYCANSNTFRNVGTLPGIAGRICCAPTTALSSFPAADCPSRGGTCRIQRLVGDSCSSNESIIGYCQNGGGMQDSACCKQNDSPVASTSTAGAGAQSKNPSLTYTLLEKIPGINETSFSLSQYIAAVYKLAIWIVGICALFMFLIGAFMYMLSAANTSKMGSAKDIMYDALIGLLLALTSYLILYVINPDLLTLRLPTSSLTTSTSQRTGGGTTNANRVAAEGQFTHVEALQALQAAGIQVTSTGSCSDQQNKNCTSLDGIPKTTIQSVIALKSGTSCSFRVTGGTEVGHSAHGPGLPVLDVSEEVCLENYFKANKTSLGYDIRKICADSNSQSAAVNCGSYIEQKPHFHLGFGT